MYTPYTGNHAYARYKTSILSAHQHYYILHIDMLPQALGTEGGGLRLTRGFVRELRVATWHRGLDPGLERCESLLSLSLSLSLSLYLSLSIY